MLFAYDTALYLVDGESRKDRGLLLVDNAGQVTWHVENVFGELEAAAAVGDGFIAYVEADTQRLVAKVAPVEGVGDGPWPIVGGDAQGTRRARG